MSLSRNVTGREFQRHSPATQKLLSPSEMSSCSSCGTCQDISQSQWSSADGDLLAFWWQTTSKCVVRVTKQAIILGKWVIIS